MIVKSLKTYFNNAMLGYYPDNEINSFFNLLAEHILKMKRTEIALNLFQVVSGKKYDKFQVAIDKLKVYEPIQYIIGETEFYGLKFKVDGSVLIPRPETEELVDWIIKGELDKQKPLKILDIGTGSGCIAIALAHHFKNSEVYGFDVSSEAMSTATQNALNNDVDIEFVIYDILERSYNRLDNEEPLYDIIVSNPPYVREMEKEMMAPNVLNYEPHLALFVKDKDPLLFYKHIAQYASYNLNDGGKLFFEINEDLAEDSINLLNGFEFNSIELKKDINGKDRMIKAIKT